jgi:hypothetical protein
MNVILIVLSWWAQDLLDRPRRKHLTTDPACEKHRAPRAGSWLDRASRGLECEPCMIRRAFATPVCRNCLGEDDASDCVVLDADGQVIQAFPDHEFGRGAEQGEAENHG